MGNVILVIIGVIVVAAIIGFLFSKDGEREDGAKLGAVVGASFLSELIPFAILAFFIVMFFKACS